MNDAVLVFLMLAGKRMAHENMTNIETLDNTWFRIDKYVIPPFSLWCFDTSIMSRTFLAFYQLADVGCGLISNTYIEYVTLISRNTCNNYHLLFQDPLQHLGLYI